MDRPRALSIIRGGVQGRTGALIRGGDVHVWAPGFDTVHEIVAPGNFDATKQEETSASAWPKAMRLSQGRP